MVSLYVTLGVFVVALLGEVLHSVRVRRVSGLVFGPLGRPARWVMAVPMLRVLATSGLAFSQGRENRLHDRDIVFCLAVVAAGSFDCCLIAPLEAFQVGDQ